MIGKTAARVEHRGLDDAPFRDAAGAESRITDGTAKASRQELAWAVSLSQGASRKLRGQRRRAGAATALRERTAIARLGCFISDMMQHGSATGYEPELRFATFPGPGSDALA